MGNDYKAWRAGMYISGSYAYTINDDVVVQSSAHKFTYYFGGELDEIFLGEKIKDDI